MSRKAPVSSSTQPQITFSSQDVQTVKQFGAFLVSNARFNLSIAEAAQLNRYMVFMTQLTEKIEAHILEVNRIINLEKSDADNPDKR